MSSTCVFKVKLTYGPVASDSTSLPDEGMVRSRQAGRFMHFDTWAKYNPTNMKICGFAF